QEYTVRFRSDDMIYGLHVTGDDVAKNIYDTQFKYNLGTALQGTVGVGSKESLYNALLKLQKGESPHRGQLGMFILAFPKSEFGESTLEKKVSLDTIEDQMLETYPEMTVGKIPTKFNYGYFSNGKLYTKNDALSKKSPTVNSISNGDNIIDTVKTKPVTNQIKDAKEFFITADKDPVGRIYINMAPLKDILVVPDNTLTVIDKKTNKEIVNTQLNPEGAVVFEAMQGRLFVVAKINGQLVPFYKSSAGTSDKIQGDWYPFFGYTGAWLVKGNVDKATGKMPYSPEIDKVAELLNKNFVFPDMYINRATNLIKDQSGKVVYDFNNHFKINRLWKKEFQSQTGTKLDYKIKGLKENTRTESG
ncbi:MAG: hypothetical protein EBT39_06590, partial [Sphingobacteriia bacterium]|nr:hypothetical protein [Candidatus Fonsibacter lacus]